MYGTTTSCVPSALNTVVFVPVRVSVVDIRLIPWVTRGTIFSVWEKTVSFGENREGIEREVSRKGGVKGSITRRRGECEDRGL